MYNEYLEKLENLKGKELKNTELKAEKIELGLVDDADKKAKEVKKVTADIEKAIHEALTWESNETNPISNQSKNSTTG